MEIRTSNSIPELRSALAEHRRSGKPLAFVPTMGYLHEGHATLIRKAREMADRVVVSVFVNPLQFGPGEDFERYPRNPGRDLDIARTNGATDMFMPSAQEFTPASITVTVDPGPMARVLCGKSRPGHFAGVATIVAKLFHVVEPTHAIFGWKDAQQFVILRRMVKDLDFAIEMVGVETIREPDGLAMSSRNVYLSPAERAEAPQIQAALACARDRAATGGELRASVLVREIRDHITAHTSARVDYVKAVSLDNLCPLNRIQPGNSLIAVAAWFGRARLIDNVRV
jgi:pantoate--beta-alanine ligase